MTSKVPPGFPEMTESEKRVYREIVMMKHFSPISPTLEEVGNALGLTRARIHQCVKSLAKKGYLAFEPKSQRSIKVLREVVGL